ncbi:MAG TPA: PRC-barrel domain-containing protein [Daejeonella sp.]|nr:PRC-barrel domain-containing protein [Daejeonella sp.]
MPTLGEFDHLQELRKSDYEIALGDLDIRGWTVKNEDGNILGSVYDLLLDTTVNKVQFIILDLTGNELNLKERKVLLPIEYAQLHEAYKNVLYPGVMANELSALPTYEKEKLNQDFLKLVSKAFADTARNYPENAGDNFNPDIIL